MAMTYTGTVTPGGPADVRELDHLTIGKLAVDSNTSNNCYLLTCRATGEKLLIDAAEDAEALLAWIGDGLKTVVTTHQHWDHHRALRSVVLATEAATVSGAPDAEAITDQTGVEIGRTVGDGDVVRVGDCELRVIAIAGHTPGSVALVYDDSAAGGHPHLFTGDSLFPGGVGATFGNAEAFAQLVDQVETKLFGTLPDSTWFYPGHGNDGLLGEERGSLPDWRARGW